MEESFYEHFDTSAHPTHDVTWNETDTWNETEYIEAVRPGRGYSLTFDNNNQLQWTPRRATVTEDPFDSLESTEMSVVDDLHHPYEAVRRHPSNHVILQTPRPSQASPTTSSPGCSGDLSFPHPLVCPSLDSRPNSNNSHQILSLDSNHIPTVVKGIAGLNCSVNNTLPYTSRPDNTLRHCCRSDNNTLPYTGHPDNTLRHYYRSDNNILNYSGQSHNTLRFSDQSSNTFHRSNNSTIHHSGARDNYRRHQSFEALEPPSRTARTRTISAQCQGYDFKHSFPKRRVMSDPCITPPPRHRIMNRENGVGPPDFTAAGAAAKALELNHVNEDAPFLPTPKKVPNNERQKLFRYRAALVLLSLFCLILIACLVGLVVYIFALMEKTDKNCSNDRNITDAHIKCRNMQNDALKTNLMEKGYMFYRESFGHCYLFVNISAKHKEAKERCKKFGADLVRVDDKLQDQFIDNITLFVSRNNMWRLGGTFKNSSWHWDSNGAEFWPKNKTAYHNFFDPNKIESDGSVILLASTPSVRGKWFSRTVDNQEEHPFICQL